MLFFENSFESILPFCYYDRRVDLVSLSPAGSILRTEEESLKSTLHQVAGFFSLGVGFF
jgi:hypothetical protein